jgi:ribosomal protein L7/L12
MLGTDEKRQIESLSKSVSALEKKVDMIMNHLNLKYNDRGSASFEYEVRDLIRRGDKIEAIKRYREQTGVGLKEAKDAIENMERGV